MNLLIKLPSRERPSKLMSTITAYQNMRTNPDTKFLITLDEDDSRCNTKEMHNYLAMWGNLTVVWGRSESKIHAVNRDLNDYVGKWDVLLLASDDMIPVVKGYDDIILQDMAKYYADTDGVLWYSDGYVGNRLNTLSILGRKYYERDRYIYHPSYKSLWSDNEFTEVANLRGRQTYIDRVIIEHRHPMNSRQVAMDGLYKKNESYFNIDKKTYLSRKEINFGLTPEECIASAK